ncbi:MAG: hypothetical protein JJE36_06835 [Coriobacteriia bacterium]|nr:hypothetical protein [Coriobacteriia bacterium]
MSDFSRATNEFFERLLANPTEDRVSEYIIREVDLGRSLFDILEDPFVRNRIPEGRRTELLENPEIIDAFAAELATLRD